MYLQACRSYVLKLAFSLHVPLEDVQSSNKNVSLCYCLCRSFPLMLSGFSIYNSIHCRHFQMKIVKCLQKQNLSAYFSISSKKFSLQISESELNGANGVCRSGKSLSFFHSYFSRSCLNSFRLSERMKFYG